jgi:hypothetical protein
MAITCTAWAASVPSALYNKSISIAFVASANAVGDRGSPSRSRQVQVTIYVSNLGRIFLQREARSGRRGLTEQRGPETTAGHFRFEGNRLIGTRKLLGGGASQMTISFEPGFQSCTASIQFGRESGTDFKFKGLNGEIYTATGVPTASTPTCSIREGNAFGQ